jgi:anti-sigma factor RsiW
MSNCKKHQKEMAAYLYGELPDEKQKMLEYHLRHCPECRKELAEIKQVLNGAVFKEEGATYIPERKGRIRAFLWQPRMRPVYAALFTGVILGAVFMFMVFRLSGPLPTTEGGLHFPPGLIENMDIEMARRDTLDYLAKSRYLLLDFVQSSPEGAAGFWQSDITSQRAGQLLFKKRYINQQLDKYQMAKARAICDQIELLFLELTQMSSELSEVEIERIRSFIEERQLLLKINLVEKELEQNEV